MNDDHKKAQALIEGKSRQAAGSACATQEACDLYQLSLLDAISSKDQVNHHKL